MMNTKFSFVLLLVLISSLVAEKSFSQTLEYHEVYKLSLDNFFGDIIGEGFAMELDESGNLYYVDNSSNTVYKVGINGKLITKFSNEGKGPGEFQVVDDLELYENEVYLFDYPGARLVVFDTNGRYNRTINLSEGTNPLHRFEVFGKSIYLIGLFPENKKLIHKFDQEGNYQSSHGLKLDLSEAPKFTENARPQLSQATLLNHGKLMFELLQAPYQLVSYDKMWNQKWKIEDEIIPKPWIDHIRITDINYRVDRYPKAADLFSVSDELIGVYWINYEKEKSFIDLRAINSGKLVKRINFPYKEFLTAFVRVKNNSGYFSSKNKDNYNISLQKWSLK